MSGLATHMLSPHPSHILIAFPLSRQWGFVTDSTGATMMRIPVSTGGMSVPNNTAYDIIFSVVTCDRDTNSQLVVAAGSEHVAADSHLGSRRLRGKARDTSNSTAGGSEDLWQRNDSAWEAAVIQFYNEANYNVHRLHLLGWDLHTYDADAGAPEKASPLLNLYSSCTHAFFFYMPYSCILMRPLASLNRYNCRRSRQRQA